jgi:hypothetical protein
MRHGVTCCIDLRGAGGVKEINQNFMDTVSANNVLVAGLRSQKGAPNAFLREICDGKSLFCISRRQPF